MKLLCKLKTLGLTTLQFTFAPSDSVEVAMFRLAEESVNIGAQSLQKAAQTCMERGELHVCIRLLCVALLLLFGQQRSD